jgi:hypothetical protein
MSAGLFQFGVAKAPGNAFHPLSSQVQRTAQATASVVAPNAFAAAAAHPGASRSPANSNNTRSDRASSQPRFSAAARPRSPWDSKRTAIV